MADHLKKVQTGQKLAIPAAAYNSFIDAAQDYQSRRQNSLQHPTPSNGQTNIVTVKNVTASDVPRFGVLAIGEPVISPTDNLDEFINRIAITGVMPDETEHLGKFVIAAEPIASGEIGSAYIQGVCPTQLVVPDESYRFADIITDTTSWLLTKPNGSTEILWKQEGIGLKWGIIRLSHRHATTEFLARITGNDGDPSNSNQWKYAWTEVELSGNSTGDKTGGRSGTTTVDYALNLNEVNHTSIYAWGVDTNGDDYPEEFDARPIGGGGTSDTHKYDVVVLMKIVTDTNGDTRYVFEATGSHDGTCEA